MVLRQLLSWELQVGAAPPDCFSGLAIAKREKRSDNPPAGCPILDVASNCTYSTLT
ncbi:hypothetical protein AGR5A_Cc170425 [Agrobacterium genomosp. 5 str. CFBP 6626]|nr:hypothetical protein AGR5A_Cc170425 [Agrobacterium genomosp. 5 str. CFBP 6626]